MLLLGEVWQGPGRVAQRLLQQDLPFTEEHRDIVALIAWKMQCHTIANASMHDFTHALSLATLATTKRQEASSLE